MIDEEVNLNKRGSLERSILEVINDYISTHGGTVGRSNAPGMAKRVINCIKIWNKSVRDSATLPNNTEQK